MISFLALAAVIGGVVAAPLATESVFRWWLNRSPEMKDYVEDPAKEKVADFESE